MLSVWACLLCYTWRVRVRVYKLRLKYDNTLITKRNSYGRNTSVERIYDTIGRARAAASQLASILFMKEYHISWYNVAKEERQAYRDKHIEIIAYECTEVADERLDSPLAKDTLIGYNGERTRSLRHYIREYEEEGEDGYQPEADADDDEVRQPK